ncbi:hypothetical protein DCS32_05005 [Dokdonia sp. Dokd-P16]|uniref:hypothetical protein n=1 Tax=Dokdonia sp. Dokd-P16 TaxID=2173169 RepID=UPI000D546A08|nr:hypothetical protein [Dokdonia sp. Dokd-P16]AWH73535.1 hypothetical protein DCS32_05005 [Dokdonia sp. Dokd-P16]
MKFFIIILFSLNLYSQEKKVCILDSISKNPVSFSSIYYSTSNRGSISDINGVVNIKTLDNSEKISISNLGYHTKDIFTNNINDTIYLNKKTEQLPEIILESTKNDLLGFSNSKKTKYLGSQISGPILVQLISNPNQSQTIINKLIFNIRSSKRDSLYVRAHLFTIDSASMKPKIELLSKSIIKKLNKRKGNLEIDISGEKIIFPKDGVYIGLEWLGEDNEADFGYTLVDNELEGLLVTSLLFKKKIWTRLKLTDGFTRASFGLEVVNF